MKPLSSNSETVAVLDEIRHSTEPCLAYGLKPEQCEQVFKEITEPMLVGAALPMVILNQFRWYVRELTKLFRTKAGLDLAFNLELCMRKWLSFGLEPNTMQFLFCEIHRRLKRMSAPPLEPSNPGPLESSPSEVNHGKEEAPDTA